MIPPNRPLRVVGDVHGDVRGFNAALQTDRFIIQLGDLADGAPDNAATLAAALAMQVEGRGVFLLGNHDWKLLRALAGRDVRIDAALARTLSQLDEDLRARLLAAVPNAPAWLRGPGTVFVHGGFHTSMLQQDAPRPLAQLTPVVSRALYGEPTGRSQPDGYPERSLRWTDRIPAGITVYCGHDWRSRDGRPLRLTGRAGGEVVFLDTGAGKGGHLSWIDSINEQYRFAPVETVRLAKKRLLQEPAMPLNFDNTGAADAWPDWLRPIDAWWRAANYLSVGQIYLLANPLLHEPLSRNHVKPRLLGHFGTTPGLNFVYVHLNRAIVAHDLDIMFIAGPGHGAPGVVASAWLDGTYTELYPDVTLDEAGMCRLFRQFSFPHGIPSHCAPETPGSIHEGGELGYSLSHAFGAVLDNPDLIAACVVGDGEAETGPLATSWHGNKFLNPAADGAVLPILHLNGYKIANPTVLARIPQAELVQLFTGCGYAPIFVSGHDPLEMHLAMAAAMDRAFAAIREIQAAARVPGAGRHVRAAWPMIILRSPKGWTCPVEVDGLATEGTWRAHQVPIPDLSTPGRMALLEEWMRSYRPAELFDPQGRPVPDILALAPAGARRMSANPRTSGGIVRPLRLPDISDHAAQVEAPGQLEIGSTQVLGSWLRDVMRANMDIFRVFGPDETVSNRLSAILEVTDRAWDAETIAGDDHLAPDGRVMEILSEHTCQGWLEGYLLTGRHGFFSCYEAFIHIVDSMFNQHAKWLKTSRPVPWRKPIASLNYLLTSHVWRQDHNGFSHQDPGFIDHVVNKKADTVRVYLPPDANTLLCVAEHCLRSWDRVNVIVAGKQPELQWLSMPDAIRHCSDGIGIWQWASNDQGALPNAILACAGDVPTLEALAAVDFLRAHLPDLRLRLVNVVDLMTLQPPSQHPHGQSDADYDALFPPGVPVVFAYHGYPALIHRLAYKRHNHDQIHVRGFEEEGSTTTPFDMVVRNRLDRFHLAGDVIHYVPGLSARAAHVRQMLRDRLVDHERYIVENGTDLPEVAEWRWTRPK